MNTRVITTVVYGCFARSFRVTRSNHEEKIWSVLRKLKVDLNVIHIDNSVDVIDGISVARYRHDLHEIAELIQLKQAEIDKQILTTYPNAKDVFDASYYSDLTRRSALRNSFLETQVADCLKRYKAISDYAIVINTDLWFDQRWKPEWLDTNSIIVGDQNPAAGYTNGFYSGPIDEVSLLLSSFDSLSNYPLRDFESISLHRGNEFNLPISQQNFRFLKIRASCEPAYQTLGFLWPKIRHIAKYYYWSAKIPTTLKIRYCTVKFPVDFTKGLYVSFKSGVKQVLVTICRFKSSNT